MLEAFVIIPNTRERFLVDLVAIFLFPNTLIVKLPLIFVILNAEIPPPNHDFQTLVLQSYPVRQQGV